MMFALAFRVTDFYSLIINELRTLIRFFFHYVEKKEKPQFISLNFTLSQSPLKNQESEIKQCKYEYGKHKK